MILHELIDYGTLRLIWWGLLGILLIGFAATDGFDMGVGLLLPFVAKTDVERRVAINTVGPVWEGNQVWFILGGGAIFAAWQPLYAVSFSGFYLAMFVVLAALILRPVAFKYRSKRIEAGWRSAWDWALFVGGFVPALIFGVAIGNVLQGVPFRLDDTLRAFYEGSFFGLLNPFALLCGLMSVAMLAMHGAVWLTLKAGGVVGERARNFGTVAAVATIALFALGGLALANWVDGYALAAPMAADGPSNPLLKDVVHGDGAWFVNYANNPWMLIAPVLGFAGAAITLVALRARIRGLSIIASGLSIFGVISTVGLAMFPFILPSSIDPRSSLTVWDASSSHLTLFIMLVVTVIFLPLILAYTAWAYRIMWGRVEEDAIREEAGHYY